VDETSEIWQSQLDWEKEWHEYHKKRLPKVRYEMMCKNSNVTQLCSMEYSHQRTEPFAMLKYTLEHDYKKLQEACEWCEAKEEDSKKRIADLKQKLRSMTSS
jgi:hypothetical protein